MINADVQIETKSTFFQRVGAFIEAMAYSDVDYNYETMDYLRKEQDDLKSQVAELKALIS